MLRLPSTPVAPAAFAALLAGACGGGSSRAAAPADHLGPEISVSEPPRGAMLMAGGPADFPVAVAGEACDPLHPLSALQISGRSFPVDGGPCVAFSIAQPSRVGLNVVRGEATNDAGERGTLAQSFLRSPEYFPADAAAPGSMAESGAVLQLGPSFLDDGDRATLNDVASVSQRQLGSLDLDAAVGPARFAQPDANSDGAIDTARYTCVLYTVTNKRTGFEAWKSGPLSHGGVAVDYIRLADGGLSLRATVAGPRLPLAVTGNVDSGCLGDAQLTVTGDASAAALVLEGEAAVALDAEGRPAVSFPSFAATVVGLQLNIDLGALASWTGLGSAIGDAVAAQLRGPVQEAIRAAVQGELAARLSAAVAALGAFERSIALPPELGGAELLVGAGIDALDFTARRALVGVALQVSPREERPEHRAASPFGAIRMGGAIPDAGGLLPSALAVGVKDDLLNQLLHAAWLAGAFDRDLSALVSGFLPGAQLALFARLPPVLMPRAGGAPGVDLGWGDVAFELGLPGPGGTGRARGFLSVILPIDRIDAGAEGIRIAFAPAAEAWVQVTDLDFGPGPAARASVTSILEGAARNLLPQALAGALAAVPLPRLDLRALDPGLPALSLSLDAPQLVRLGRYQFLAGSVVESP